MNPDLPPDEPIRLSRVGSPELRRTLTAAHSVSIVPAVRGITVWEHSEGKGTALVERPNWVGRIDSFPTHGKWIDISIDVTAKQVEAAYRLRNQLTQLRGVRAPWRPVEAPWFVLLVSADPTAVAAAAPGVRLVDLPEFPGGLRIAIPDDISQKILEKYAMVISTAITTAQRNALDTGATSTSSLA